MSFTQITYEVDGPAAIIMLNRPEQLNPIDSAMLAALDARLDEIAGDPSVRAVLVTGAGRAFSAGGDLKGYRTLQRDPVAFPRFVSELHRIFGRLRTAPVPTVALVNGVAVARREIDDGVPVAQLVRGEVEHERAEHEVPVGSDLAEGSPRSRGDTRTDLGEGDGLDEVVVGPEPQSGDPGLEARVAADDDGGRAARARDVAQQREPVTVG